MIREFSREYLQDYKIPYESTYFTFMLKLLEPDTGLNTKWKWFKSGIESEFGGDIEQYRHDKMFVMTNLSGYVKEINLSLSKVEVLPIPSSQLYKISPSTRSVIRVEFVDSVLSLLCGEGLFKSSRDALVRELTNSELITSSPALENAFSELNNNVINYLYAKYFKALLGSASPLFQYLKSCRVRVFYDGRYFWIDVSNIDIDESLIVNGTFKGSNYVVEKFDVSYKPCLVEDCGQVNNYILSNSRNVYLTQDTRIIPQLCRTMSGTDSNSKDLSYRGIDDKVKSFSNPIEFLQDS